MSKLVHTLLALIVGSAVFAVVAIAFADNANFVVQPLKEHVIALSLQETDSVSGSFSVVSNDETGINFYVTNPENRTILQYDNVNKKSFSFTAQATGTYQLHFDNSVSSVYSKTVALNYNTTRYILGMPQEQFLLIIVAVGVVIGIVAYSLLQPK